MPDRPSKNPLIDTPVYETKGPPTATRDRYRAIMPGYYRIRTMDGKIHATYNYQINNRLRAMNIMGDGTKGFPDSGWTKLDGSRGIDIHVGLSAQYTDGCILAAPGMKFDGGTSKGYSPYWDMNASLVQISALVKLIENFKKIKKGTQLKINQPQNCVTVCVRNPAGDVFKEVIVMENILKTDENNPKKARLKWKHSEGKNMQVKIINETEYEVSIGDGSQILRAENTDPACAILGKCSTEKPKEKAHK